MKKTIKPIIAVALCYIMLIGSVVTGSNSLAEAFGTFMVSVFAEGIDYARGDIIEYGTYPQTK